MNFFLEIWIALRYLKSRQDEGFISIVSLFSFLGITLGVATLIIVMSVMNGFRTEMLSKILGLNGHSNIIIKSDNLEHINNIFLRIKDFKSVQFIQKSIESTVMASSNKFATGVKLKGIEAKILKDRNMFKGSLSEEESKNFITPGRIILGDKLAERLGLKIGDALTLISPTGVNTPFGPAPNASIFILAGTFDLGMFEYDTSIIFIKLEDIRKLLGLNSDYIDMFEVFYSDPDDAEIFTEEINNILFQNGIYAVPWTKRYEQFFSALKVEKNVMFIILFLIILVAVFNVVSSMVMLVKDKESSISILRTIGISKYSIMRIFMIVGSFIGVLGTLVGFLIGIVFSLNIEKIQLFVESLLGNKLFEAEIYFLSNVPSKIDYSEVIWLIIGSLLLAFLSTIYPALRASSIDPAKVLRYG